MNADAVVLAALPGLAYAFVLVLCRVGAAVMLLPGLGEAGLPAFLRAGITITLTLLLLPVVLKLMPPAPPGVIGVAAMAGAEIATGLWLGWLARLIVFALPMAGQVIGTMMGISSVLQPDAMLGGQASALSRFFALLAPVLLFASGLYALPILALADSFTLIAPGALLPAADATQGVVAALGHAFALAIELAAPFLLVGTVWQVGLGLVGRLVPQLQVYFVAMPAQLLGGLALLAGLGVTLASLWLAAAQAGFAHLPGAG